MIRECIINVSNFYRPSFLIYPQMHTHIDKSIDDKKPVDSYFLQTLREICGHMCDMDGVDGVDPSEFISLRTNCI